MKDEFCMNVTLCLYFILEFFLSEIKRNKINQRLIC